MAGACTFEKGRCTWTNAQTDDFDWRDGTGSTTSGGTGPSSDHTLGTSAGIASLFVHWNHTILMVHVNYYSY